MAQYGPTNQTVEFRNPRTQVDLPILTTVSVGPFPSPQFPNQLGVVYYDNPVTIANPNGAPTKYRYLRCVFTATPAIQSTPAAVWYVDATMTTVTATIAEAWGGASSFAGLMMPNSTDVSTLTTAILKANGGAAVWVAVAGIVTGVATAAAGAGAQQFATQADWTTTGGFSTVAVGGATVGRQAAFAFAASPSTVYVNAESI